MLSMNCSGDRVTAIGGESSEGSIVFEKCSTVIKATGIAIIGIGSAQGESNIIIKETAKIDVVCNGNDAVGIGCFKGKTRVVSSGNIACRTDGERPHYGCFYDVDYTDTNPFGSRYFGDFELVEY